VGETARRIVLACVAGVACELNPDFDPPATATEPTQSTGTGQSGSDGSGADTESPPGEISVANLRAVWGTPNQIRWTWESSGSSDALLRYELVVGPTEADVEGRTAATDVWTEARNPELGRFLLPRTGGEDPVVATVTDGLVPDRVYHAQLVAIDTSGNRSRSNIAAGRTSEPPIASIVVFSDGQDRGYRLPESFVISQSRPYAGTSHLEYISSCDGVGECWENLRLQELGIDLGAITSGSYSTTAFVEFALLVDAQTTPWWCSAWLWYDGSDAGQLANYTAWTARPTGEYYLVQIPLRDFRIGADPPPHSDLETHGLFGFNVGCPWGEGATVLVDEVHVRW
jgi:hypothetical protein